MKNKNRRKTTIVVVSLISALVLILSVFFGVLFGTNVIQKAIIDFMCKDEPSSLPKNYTEILASTTLTTIEYQNGLDLDIIESSNLSDDALCVLIFHGGYYVGGGRHNQEPFARLLASYGYRVLNIDYSLAPKNKYPTQLLQANNALNFAYSTYPNAKGFVVSGDSAGAHLAAQLAVMINNQEFKTKYNIDKTLAKENLLGFIGNCGFYQASTVKDSGFFLIDNAMQMLLGDKKYIQNDMVKDLDLIDYAKLFPNTLLICGDNDPFINQNIDMFNALKSNGKIVEKYFPKSDKNELGHEFQCNYNFEESYIAMEKTIEFLNTLV